MPLESLNLQEIRNELRDAITKELPLLEEIRREVRQLKVRELGYRQCYAIAPVATDGGENRFTFDPINLEIVRVVDSEGRQRFQKILPLSAGIDILQKMFQESSQTHEPLLSRFLERLGLDYDDLSYVLEAKATAGDLRQVIRPFRDIAEWAVLLDIAWNPGRTKIVLMRDGLLRTEALSKDVMPKLAKSFEDAYNQTGSLLVGVAKRSKVINYLSLAIYLEKTFARKSPCFCEVPENLEAKAYIWAKSWMGGHSFGKLHLAKLVEHEDALVLPIDVPNWLLSRRKEVFEYLAETSKASFPVIGYPEPLQKAHDNANLRGLEMTILEHFLVDQIVGAQTSADGERTLEHVAFGRGIQRGGWKEYG